MKKSQRVLSLMSFFSLLFFQSNTLGASTDLVAVYSDMNFWINIIALFVMMVVLVVAIYLYLILKHIVDQNAVPIVQKSSSTSLQKESSWKKFYHSLTDSVPLSNESTIELDHNYDGIKELDNHLPPWWKYLFYISVVFAVVYMYVYHIGNTFPLPAEEYSIELALADAAKATTNDGISAVDETNIVFVDDATMIANGKKEYERNCMACHKANGEGGIGPNLTDEYWLHGGSIQDIYNTIKQGVPNKGMIAWKDVLSPSKMNEISSYIVTLQGTNPANAKASEGEHYQP